MRIGVDARPLNQRFSGIGYYLENLLATMVGDGRHEWFLYGHGEEARARLTGASINERVAATLSGTAGLLRTQFLYPRWARADHLDVFWSPRHHLPLLLTQRLPTVVTIHDLVWKLYPQTMGAGHRLSEQLQMPVSVRGSCAILATSESTRRDLVSCFPALDAAKITVTHLASRLPASAAPANAERPYALFVGTIEPRKNLPGLLRALAEATRKGLDLDLKVAGSGGWKHAAVTALIESLSLTGRVTYREAPSDDELASLYAGCEFLVMPSLYEGFGLPVVEAMSFGKPVIASNVSSLPEIAGDAALLVDPTDTAAIAAALRQLATDTTLRERLARNARARAASFSWELAARRTLAVIEAAGST